PFASAVRLPRAGAAFVAVWLLAGIAVFARMTLVYARYLDVIAPAAALALGAGAAWLAQQAAPRRAAGAPLALAGPRARGAGVPDRPSPFDRARGRGRGGAGAGGARPGRAAAAAGRRAAGRGARRAAGRAGRLRAATGGQPRLRRRRAGRDAARAA